MSALTARRLLLAAVVGGASVLQVAGFATHPEVGESAAENLAAVAADPDQWVLTHLLAASAAALSMLSVVVLAALVRRRGVVLTTVGATLAVLGGGLLALAFAAEVHLLPLAADPSLDRSAMTALAELEEGSPLMAVLPPGFALNGLGTLLLSLGLLRSGVVAKWKPALVIVGLLASTAAGPGESVGALLLAPAVLGFLALAVDVARGPRPDQQVAEPAPRELVAAAG